MEKIKKIMYNIFGVKEHIRSKLAISFFIVCIIFFLFLMNSPENTYEFIFFMLAFDVSFSLWLLIAKGVDSATKFIIELVRLVVFLGFLFFSIYFFYFFDFYNGIRRIIYTILSIIGLFTSVFYFISLFNAIYNFSKNIFEKIKSKLFSSVHSADEKAKSFTSFVQNISALLIAIGGLALTVKGVIEPLIKIISNYIDLSP